MEESFEELISESIIHSGEVPKVLQENTDSALSHIEKEDYEKALQVLSNSERLLEVVTTQGGMVDADYILATIHNTALCYQKLGMLEECASYLDACIYNIRTKKVMVPDSQGKIGLSERLKRVKYECKSHIQLCALLSQLGQHELALTHGKTAIKKCEVFMTDCYTLCTDHVSKHRQKSIKPLSRKILEKPSYVKFNDLVIKSLPSVEYIINKLKNKRMRVAKTPKLDMRTVLGVQRNNDWIYTYNIGDMMLVQPLSIYDLKNNIGVQAELTRDLMLEKILMTIVSHFCVATEVRFLATNSSKMKPHEGKIWHKKAIELGQPFLPANCPLLLHVMNSYMRNYSEDSSKAQEKTVKKYKNKTPNPELKRPRSTSASKTKGQDDRPSTAAKIKRKPSPRVGDRTPPARNQVKDLQFRFNSPKVEKVVPQKPKIVNPFAKEEEDQEIKGRSVHNSSESDQEIVISSYDLYGINSDDESEESESSQIDSTGGKLNGELVISGATGGNSCLFKA